MSWLLTIDKSPQDVQNEHQTRVKEIVQCLKFKANRQRFDIKPRTTKGPEIM